MTEPMRLPESIEAFLGMPAVADQTDALRSLCEVLIAADPRLRGEIKWNAPSFTLDRRDVLTTGVNRDGSIRLVLHRGAAKASPGTTQPLIDDPERLLEWRGVDRAIATFSDAAAVRERASAVRNVVLQWIAAAKADPS